MYGLARESRLLSPTLGFAACSYAASPSLCSAFSLFAAAAKGLLCGFSLRPMPLGLAGDDPLAGAPALDAFLTESERASSPMERGAGGFWACHFRVPKKFLSLLPQVVQSRGLIGVKWVSRTLRIGQSDSFHFSRKDLVSARARWSRMPHLDTRDASPCSGDGKRGRTPLWSRLSARWFWRASIRLAGALASVACLAEDARLSPSGKALPALALEENGVSPQGPGTFCPPWRPTQPEDGRTFAGESLLFHPNVPCMPASADSLCLHLCSCRSGSCGLDVPDDRDCHGRTHEERVLLKTMALRVRDELIANTESSGISEEATISAKIITVLTRYRPIVLELI